MESRNEEKKSRFQIEKLEERIAPAHLSIELPAAAANGAHGIEEAANNAPGRELGHLRKLIITLP